MTYLHKLLAIHFEFDRGVPNKISERESEVLLFLKSQLYDSKLGYSKTKVLGRPELQDELFSLAKECGLKEKSREPILCLTHDIDYLQATPQMNLKRIVAQKKLKWSSESYVESIKTLVNIDETYGTSTFFICLPVKSGNPLTRMRQWILDPSYEITDKIFKQFRDVIHKPNVEIGVHGSFFSIVDGTLSKEIKSIEGAFMSKKVTSGRQHWLNLPGRDSFSVLEKSGVQFDSTLGWNDMCSYRGGFADIFPIPDSNIYEIPLVLMDGVLFDTMKLSELEVVDQCKKVLDDVYERSGCISINWHDRAASATYGWLGAYEAVLNYARKKGFSFKSVKDAMESRGLT